MRCPQPFQSKSARCRFAPTPCVLCLFFADNVAIYFEKNRAAYNIRFIEIVSTLFITSNIKELFSKSPEYASPHLPNKFGICDATSGNFVNRHVVRHFSATVCSFNSFLTQYPDRKYFYLNLQHIITV